MATSKSTLVGAEKLQKEIKRIAESGKYDKVKHMTMPDYPTDSLMAICSRGEKDYLVDYTGEKVVELFEADELRPNLGSITPATFRLADKWGMVNSKGEVILAAQYDSIKPEANEYIFLTLDGKEGFIAGGHLIEPKFDNIEIGDDEYIEVILNGIKGYIDENDEFTTDKSEAYYNFMMFI